MLAETDDDGRNAFETDSLIKTQMHELHDVLTPAHDDEQCCI